MNPLPKADTLGERYIAAIALDGDSIGAWVRGEKLPAKAELLAHHGDFSAALSRFALERARSIVEGDTEGENKGFLIYAGGDDVVALIPADLAISISEKLRSAFLEECKDIGPAKDGPRPDAYAGIAIAHMKAPLQDLIREAQIAEKRANNLIGRRAFSVSLMKRSGEISYWGAKWDSGRIELHEEIAKAMRKNHLSAKFPHRVCQLLAPYQAGTSDAEDFPAEKIITREFETAISRQSTSKITMETRQALHKSLTYYLRSLSKISIKAAKSPSRRPSSPPSPDSVSALHSPTAQAPHPPLKSKPPHHEHPSPPSQRCPVFPGRAPHVRQSQRARRSMAIAERDQSSPARRPPPGGHRENNRHPSSPPRPSQEGYHQGHPAFRRSGN